jgi:hypothetical protein
MACVFAPINVHVDHQVQSAGHPEREFAAELDLRRMWRRREVLYRPARERNLCHCVTNPRLKSDTVKI